MQGLYGCWVGAVSKTPASRSIILGWKSDDNQTKNKWSRVCCDEGSKENVQYDKKNRREAALLARVIRERHWSRDPNEGDTFCGLPREKHSR